MRDEVCTKVWTSGEMGFTSSRCPGLIGIHVCPYAEARGTPNLPFVGELTEITINWCWDKPRTAVGSYLRPRRQINFPAEAQGPRIRFVQIACIPLSAPLQREDHPATRHMCASTVAFPRCWCTLDKRLTGRNGLSAMLLGAQHRVLRQGYFGSAQKVILSLPKLEVSKLSLVPKKSVCLGTRMIVHKTQLYKHSYLLPCSASDPSSVQSDPRGSRIRTITGNE